METLSELFYLVGLLRDGSVYYDRASRNYYVVWYSKSREFLEFVVADKLSRVFPHTRPRMDQYKKGHWRIRISSKQIYDMVKTSFEFPDEGLGQSYWGIPTLIREADILLKLSHIRGIADAEGDVSLVNKYVEISQKNREVLQWIKMTLRRVGIETGSVVLADRKTLTYKIVISGKMGLTTFHKLVNFEHPLKKLSLEKLVNSHPTARRQQT